MKLLQLLFPILQQHLPLFGEGCTLVFADIDEHTYNIDPTKIEKLINESTVVILATLLM